MEIGPAEFEREKAALTIISPSSLTVFQEDDLRDENRQPTRLSRAPALRGTLIHRILAEFGKTGTFPAVEKAASYLRREGIGAAESAMMAREALSEVDSCLADPWLKALYAVPAKDRAVERPIECVHGEDAVYSGIIDLAAEMGGRWVLVDFKTSRPGPGESMDEFCGREVDAYRGQLEAYREMWAKWKGITENEVDVFIFWTALRVRREA